MYYIFGIFAMCLQLSHEIEKFSHGQKEILIRKKTNTWSEDKMLQKRLKPGSFTILTGRVVPAIQTARLLSAYAFLSLDQD